MAADDIPLLAFATAEEWERWLDAHDEDPGGVWLKLPKKGSGVASVTYREAVDVALCHGWIDGQAKGIDEVFRRQRFTPRRARSNWSERNRRRALELIDEGRMRPAGLREIERARADGRWDRP